MCVCAFSVSHPKLLLLIIINRLVGSFRHNIEVNTPVPTGPYIKALLIIFRSCVLQLIILVLLPTTLFLFTFTTDINIFSSSRKVQHFQ